MALALALACAAVTGEFSDALLERTRHYHFRLHQLSSNINAMRGEIASEDREIAGMRTAAEVDDGLRRIIAEPDSRLIRLEALGRAAGMSGVIAFSPSLRRASIEIGGLPVLPRGGAYTLWWVYGKRAPIRATGITLGGTDKAALMIALPAGDGTIDGAIVTRNLSTDMGASIARPSGDPVLEGAVVPSRKHPEIPKHKSG